MFRRYPRVAALARLCRQPALHEASSRLPTQAFQPNRAQRAPSSLIVLGPRPRNPSAARPRNTQILRLNRRHRLIRIESLPSTQTRRMTHHPRVVCSAQSRCTIIALRFLPQGAGDQKVSNSVCSPQTVRRARRTQNGHRAARLRLSPVQHPCPGADRAERCRAISRYQCMVPGALVLGE